MGTGPGDAADGMDVHGCTISALYLYFVFGHLCFVPYDFLSLTRGHRYDGVLSGLAIYFA